MEIKNTLPIFLDCLSRWAKVPTAAQFDAEFARPLSKFVGDFFEDFRDALLDLDWEKYRSHALTLDPVKEEARVRENLKAVENLFGFKLHGELVILGAFEVMDGYARFDRGSHRVFLGVDESFDQGRYLDVLTVHELVHVARESRPEVWEGFGLNPKMTQNEFTENQPVIEHLMGEGFSCAVSEILVPGEARWTYAYQSEESWAVVAERARFIDQAVKELISHPDGDYGALYGLKPLFSHYVWAWQWTKDLIKNHGAGDPKKLVSRCSKDFIEDALRFQLKVDSSRP